MNSLRVKRSIAVLLLTVVPLARAGQPLVTDDAAIVAPKSCQLEAWTRFVSGGGEYWAQPACNFSGNLELSVGVARTRFDDGEPASALVLQAKSVVFRRDDATWSYGVVGGGLRVTGAPQGGSPFQTYYAKALASWYPAKDLEIDVNLGAANAYGTGTFALAGAAVQYAVVPQLQLLAEVFRDEPGPGKYQVGARWLVLPNRFEAYVSYGNFLNGTMGRGSAILGIRVQTPAFLP